MRVIADNLVPQEEARPKLIGAIEKLAKTVGATMGTRGKNALMESIERPGYFPTNDGITVLSRILFKDKIEDMGRSIILESVDRANRKSGDGSSTTVVLASEMLKEGFKDSETSPMQLMGELEAELPNIKHFLEEQKEEIAEGDTKTLEDVATISAESREIGKKVSEIYKEIGKDGIISWGVSNTEEDYFVLGKGITMEGTGIISPYMYDPGKEVATMRNVPVLIVRDGIKTALEFETLFQDMSQKGMNQILIFCEDMDMQVVADLIQTHRIRGFRSIVVKMPVLFNDEWYEDLALASGAKIVEGAAGKRLKDTDSEVLGSFEHIQVYKDEVQIDGMKDLTAHVMKIQAEDNDRAIHRANRLNVNSARYFVGGNSESGIAYRRLKVEDAIGSARAALKSGILPGGGLALYNVSQKLGNSSGAKILKVALQAPIRHIVRNAGTDFEAIRAEIGEEKGFNTESRRVDNLKEHHIIDAFDVVWNAVKSALGVVSTVLTTGDVVLLPQVEEEKNVAPR